MAWNGDKSSLDFNLGQYSLFLSQKGMMDLPKNMDPKDPAKNFIWTTDPKIELPILIAKEGGGSMIPLTCMDLWKQVLQAHGDKPALSDKINGKWQTISYNEYYELAIKFALGLIRLGITERSAVSILGYNCSQWMIDFFGAVFANCVAVGHYLTNTPEAVKYVIEHSDSEIIAVENQEQLDKVLKVWDTLPNLKYAIVWQNYTVDSKYAHLAKKVMSHTDFLKFEVTEPLMDQLERRMRIQAPGNAVSYVYTSGTTGNPKGVMLSHDNYVWTARSIQDSAMAKLKEEGTPIRAVSYLPLSHVAAQFADVFLALNNGASLFFTDINALKGTLIDYLLEVRPVIFLGVPRIYEKMEEKVRSVLEKKPFIYGWAKHYGEIGTDAQMKNKPTPFMFGVMEKIVFNKVKQNMGLDQCVKFLSGAAPLPLKTRQFFFNLNVFLNNTFGMSETAGPMTSMLTEDYPLYDLNSAGKPLPGTECIVIKTDPNLKLENSVSEAETSSWDT